MGRSFKSVMPIEFPLVAALAIAYLLVLGPMDYWLVQRWLRRPWTAWITFPIIVLVFGAVALGLAEWRRGSNQPRANCLELVDVDTVTGQARGTFWATLFSPRARRFNFALQVDAVAKASATRAEALISWWGLPGEGIGGMQSRGTGFNLVREGYRYAEDLEALEGVPILDSATKSLLVRWTASAKGLVEAQLQDQDGLATGTIVNRTGFPLRNARLLYNDWGYWLGNLANDQPVEVGEQLDPRRVKTIVTLSALGRAAAGASGQTQRSLFMPERASVLELLNVLMFYQAAGGQDFSQLPSRLQAFCDLSGLLKPGMGRAILVAEAERPGSELVDASGDRALGENDDFAELVYRFVLPVAEQADEP
jgi:hypothetical protein